MKISQTEYEQIKHLKELDIQQCSFCQKITILNLNWQPFKELYCLTENKEHMLCPELCYKAALNIFDCQLYKKEQRNQKKRNSN